MLNYQPQKNLLTFPELRLVVGVDRPISILILTSGLFYKRRRSNIEHSYSINIAKVW